MSYGAVALLVILSIFSPVLGAIYLLIIIMTTVVKAVGIAVRTLQGHGVLMRAMRVDWAKRLAELENPEESYLRVRDERNAAYGWREHVENLRVVAAAEIGYFPVPSMIYNGVIIPAYQESFEVLVSTIDAIKNTTFNNKRIMIALGYEERGGAEIEATARRLLAKYRGVFAEFIIVKHPEGLVNEVIGKGGNITYAGKRLAEVVQERGLRYGDVIITTLDSDNRPSECYFDYVAYEYIVHEERKHLSYQPVSLFMGNIWDTPAPMRIIATGNSFWNIICSMRPHALRNFAAHSQPLDALAEMDFWSTRTIVEDGHQYWRSLFYFRGNYGVLPIHAPIYQDAVLGRTVWQTLKAQFIQLRRWDYGASDIAFVGVRLFSRKREVPFLSLFSKFVRLLDSHVTLAATAPIVAFGGWVPLITNYQSRDLLAYNLPNIVSVIQLIASAGLFITIILSMKMLPKRPARYRRGKSVLMVIQWVLMPVVSIVYSSAAAFYSQTRLAVARYMDKFDVTEKVRRE
jgi:cellulose synthase/poly-beta-1,6-N-acetylglucosamine synthase-like glycosyltransferase